MVTRRGALITLGMTGAAILLPTAATASVSRALSIRELLGASRAVVHGEPVEAFSQWETIGDRRRIVTFTRVLVNEGVVGEPESEILVRTLGGRVGKIGQVVHGEAALRLNEPSVLFLQDSSEGITRVTGMAQGHYRMLSDDQGAIRLRTSPRLGTLLPPTRSPSGSPDSKAAVRELEGLTFPQARSVILKAYQK